MRFNPALWWHQIESVPRNRFLAGAAFAIVAIGFVDHFTGPIVSLAIFYLIPVAATAWVVGRNAANLLALFAAITWAVADQIGPLAEPRVATAYLNDVSMLAVFVFVNILLSTLRREIQRQRDLMQEVQRHLLPGTMPRFPGVDVASRWIPAWTVAGDYYDVMSVPGNRIAICLADVSGKGMAAALIMSNVQATVRALAGDGLPPDKILMTLNELLHERLRPGLFVTMFYGLLNVESGQLTFASAGHNPAILRRSDGSVARLHSTGPIAGIFPGAAYQSVTTNLGIGDRVVIYSDGITEFSNARGEEFGENRLLDVLRDDPGKSAEDTCATVIDRVRKFAGARQWIDDVTMLVIVRTAEKEIGTDSKANLAPSCVSIQ